MALSYCNAPKRHEGMCRRAMLQGCIVVPSPQCPHRGARAAVPVLQRPCRSTGAAAPVPQCRRRSARTAVPAPQCPHFSAHTAAHPAVPALQCRIALPHYTAVPASQCRIEFSCRSARPQYFTGAHNDERMTSMMPGTSSSAPSNNLARIANSIRP